VPQVEQMHLTLPDHMSLPTVFRKARVAEPLVFCLVLNYS